MTTIVGVHTEHHMVLMADTLVTADDMRLLSPMNKITQCGDWAFASTGQGGVAQAVAQELPALLDSVAGPSTLMVAIAKLRDRLRDNWGVRLNNEAEGLEELQVSVILASPFGMFHVTSDRYVATIGAGEFCAAGSGAAYAMGAMHAARRWEPIRRVASPESNGAKEIALEAMQAASALDVYTGAATTEWCREK